MSVLETRGLTVTYGGLNANDDVNISVEAGRLTGLIGPNGAGKTTFIDAMQLKHLLCHIYPECCTVHCGSSLSLL